MSEKTNEEKIREYVWLHADKPPAEIQAGLLKEFGGSKSLNWIAHEQKAYLAAAEPSVEENASAAPSIDEETVKRVAAKFPSATEELIRKIVGFKMTTRFGCRRISQKLNHALGKDTVQRIWKMYQSIAKSSLQPLKSSKPKELDDVDTPTTHVADKEDVTILRHRNEVLERENVYLCLNVGGDALIVDVTEREIAKKHLETYQRFRQYCEREHLSTAAALQKMGETASHFLDSIDDWYDQQAKDGDVGLEALAWTVTLEVHAFLRPQTVKKITPKEEAKGESIAKKPFPWEATRKTKKAPEHLWANTKKCKPQTKAQPRRNSYIHLEKKPRINKNV